MGFRFVPKSVTLNDLERCNGHYFVGIRSRKLTKIIIGVWLNALVSRVNERSMLSLMVRVSASVAASRGSLCLGVSA